MLKISGEALMGDRDFGIDPDTISQVAQQISKASQKDIQIAVVVGGGNFWRGQSAAETGMDRATADYAGMLGTVINALALQDSLEKVGCEVRTQTALPMAQIAEPYIRRRAIRHLEKNRAVIFAAGTGNPFMTTDTAAALRAIEVECNILLMAKQGVDGIYSADPAKNKDAKLYSKITHMDALQQRLEVMDSTALSLCMEHDLPISVFDVRKKDNIRKAIAGGNIGTLVTSQTDIG
ncbi:MAG: UMP kinase [Tepidiformaceae bacterium]